MTVMPTSVAARRMVAFSRVSTKLLAVIALVALLGWVVDMPLLYSFVEGAPSMKPNTAVCFLLSAFCLWSWHRLEASGLSEAATYRSAVIGSSLLLVGIAGITLSQGLFGWSSGLDQLLLEVPVTDAAPPGRMSPATALTFLVLGVGLGMLALSQRWVPALQTAAAAGFLISLLMLMAFLFEAELYKVRLFDSLSVPTAVSFLVLSSGLLTARADAGWISVFSGPENSARIGRRTVLSALIVLPLITWLCAIAEHDFGIFGVYFGVTIVTVSSFAALAALSWINTRNGIEADKEISNLNRIYAVLSGINTLILRVTSKQSLYDDACQIAWEVGQLPWVWIAEVGATGAPSSLVAFRGDQETRERLERFERKRFSRDAGDDAPDQMFRSVVEDRRPVVIEDLALTEHLRVSPADRRHLEALREAGVRSLAKLPIVVNDKVVGVFALHAAAPAFFDEIEMRLLKELVADIGFALETMERRETLDYLSRFDELTGLANRRAFVDLVGREIVAAHKSGERITVVLMDLRRFQKVNETFGRAAGDQVLKEVTRRLLDTVPRPESLGRIQGDYFGMIVTTGRGKPYDYHLVAILGECLRTPFVVDGQPVNLQGTFGAAIYPNDGSDAETLLVNAEATLRKAKETGKPLLFYEPEINARVAESLHLESKLRDALELDQFVLHYQPKYTSSTGKIDGVEALIRWRDPDTGLVPPGMFIPLLEQTGLILPVGRWALKQAAADIMRWHQMGLQAPRVAVNVSAIQLDESSFVADVASALEETRGLPPMLDVEITESMLMGDVESVGNTLSVLRNIGIQIAIDDFGTGYSSLAYLVRLPIDTLKIDRSFVLGMTGSDDDEGTAIVSSIISLAHALRATVVAEGVETEPQAAKLRELGCDSLQGFLFSRPIPFDELATRLDARATEAPHAGATEA